MAAVRALRPGPRPATAAELRALTLLRLHTYPDPDDGAAHALVELAPSADPYSERFADVDRKSITRARLQIERLLTRIACAAWPYMAMTAAEHGCLRGAAFHPRASDGWWTPDGDTCDISLEVGPRHEWPILQLVVPPGQHAAWRPRMKQWLTWAIESENPATYQ